MKRQILIVAILFLTQMSIAQMYTSQDDKKAKEWGFNNLKPGNDYVLGLKKGKSDFVSRNFLKGYKYFICIKADNGIKNLDAWLINEGDNKEIVSNTKGSNKTVYFKFTPNYTRKVKIKAKNVDADNPNKVFNVKI